MQNLNYRRKIFMCDKENRQKNTKDVNLLKNVTKDAVPVPQKK